MSVNPSMQQAGEPIPGYRLIERLGRGGYGEVWKCEAPGGLMKAIKFVYGDIEGACDDKSAEQELKALNRVKTIRHPFVLSLERFDIVQGQLLIVMELADRNLWDRFQECRKNNLVGIPRDELLGYMDETAEALDLMNTEYQLQHLDIKPQNLFLVYNHVKVADFGLAKDLQGLRATMTGGVTPLYAAPETFEGWISRFCDQYSLAIVYQELVSGERPFSGTNMRHLMMQHMSAVPNVSSLPEEERPIILRALSKSPNDRFASCRDMVQALRAVKPSKPKDGTLKSGPDSIRIRAKSESTTGADSSTSNDKDVADTHQPQKAYTQPKMPRLTTPTLRSPEDSGSGIMAQPAPGKEPSSHLIREKKEKGVLYPMLVVGLGGFGGWSIRQMKQELAEQFPGETVPNLQFLYIDTDSQSIASFSDPNSPFALSGDEVLHLPLHRPAHYLKQTQLPPIDLWHDAELLYKIAREGGTEGNRALGRLSLLDQVNDFRARIVKIFKRIRRDSSNMEFSFWKGLGLRSNFPRVTIISSLTGGTGSGMVLDVAYLLRRELAKAGFDPDRIDAHFFVPKVNFSSENNTVLDKSLVALREIDAFMSGREAFRAHYNLKEEPLVDAAKPFDSIELIPLEKPSVKNPTTRHFEHIAESLIQEGFTNLGRSRQELDGKRYERERHPLPPYKSVGLIRLTWPRSKMLKSSMGKLAQRLCASWTDPEGVSQVDFAAFASEFLQKKRLDPDSLRKQLETHLQQKLNFSLPDRLASLTEKLTSGRDDLTKLEVCANIEPLIQFIGAGPNARESPTAKAYDEIFKEIAKESETRLSEIVVNLVELPGKRFGFALRFLKCIDLILTESIDAIKKSIDEGERAANGLYEKLLTSIGNLEDSTPKFKGWRTDPRQELAELSRDYATKRLESQREHALRCILQSWKGILPEFTRDINFCREQVKELLEHPFKATRSSARKQSLEFHILPGKAKEVGEAVDQILKSISPADWMALDERLQVRMRRECHALVRICLDKARYRDRFENTLLDELKSLAETLLKAATSVDMFLGEGRDPQAQHREIQKAYDELMSSIPAGKTNEGTILHYLGIPETMAKSQFQTLLADVLSDPVWQDYPTGHEIVMVCEKHFPADNLFFPGWDQSPPVMSLQDKFLFSRTDYIWFRGFNESVNQSNRAAELLAESVF